MSKLSGWEILTNIVGEIKMAKRNIMISVIVIIFTLTGCLLKRAPVSDEKRFDKILTQFLEAVNSGDAEELKSLFALSVIANTNELDNQIKDFLRFCPLKLSREAKERPTLNTQQHFEKGLQNEELTGVIKLKSDKETFYLYLNMVCRDKNNAENEGIHCIDLVTEEAHNGKYFMFQYDIKGIHTQNISNEHNNVMLLYGNAKRYKPVNRELEEDFLLHYVEQNSSFQDLIRKIGEPNGKKGNWEYVFEITPDENEKRYAICEVHGEKGKENISKIVIVNEEKILYTLWED